MSVLSLEELEGDTKLFDETFWSEREKYQIEQNWKRLLAYLAKRDGQD